MNTSGNFKGLSKNFQEEVKQLHSKGVKDWLSLENLKNEELFLLAQNTRATTRNLKLLKGMATFITKINLSESEAAFLLHSGIASLATLSSLTPSEVIQKTGRLERHLNTGREPFVNLKIAKEWIQNAKRANYELTQ